MLVRMPDSKLTFANFARSLVYGAIVSLKLGMDILTAEKVQIDSLLGHGGFFKTPGVGQKLMAAALGTPVSVMETAGEGGPWGMALLAAYMVRKAEGETIEEYLANKVFAQAKSVTVQPEPDGVAGFEVYIRRYQAALQAEKAAAGMQ
jgi:sugar (pentulose or hexulose) kinase